MNVASIHESDDEFYILQTTERVQTGTILLPPGEATNKRLGAHWDCDQVVLLIKGRLTAEIGGEKRELVEGDSVIVPADTRHRFTNESSSPALACTVYAPPFWEEGDDAE